RLTKTFDIRICSVFWNKSLVSESLSETKKNLLNATNRPPTILDFRSAVKTSSAFLYVPSERVLANQEVPAEGRSDMLIQAETYRCVGPVNTILLESGAL
ncbi:MAG: hypothetical protein LYZ66_06510, partial [Nitrososphaerales archaeon]|nr:hypothetical protein [Nitrososphaerales archaeon]